MLDYSSNLLKNVHTSLCVADEPCVRGDYDYWHYACDGFDDRGWGCGYRTLQTICSWVINNKNLKAAVPSINTIQKTLVAVEDKENTFIGSREWIGSIEVCIVLHELYGVLSKIIHISSGKELINQVGNIERHFAHYGSPIMMGGDRDCSSKCILGIRIENKNVSLLILDPHLMGKPKSVDHLHHHWLRWQNVNDFVDSSFYNLCLPQLKYHV